MAGSIKGVGGPGSVDFGGGPQGTDLSKLSDQQLLDILKNPNATAAQKLAALEELLRRLDKKNHIGQGGTDAGDATGLTEEEKALKKLFEDIKNGKLDKEDYNTMSKFGIDPTSLGLPPDPGEIK